MTNMVNLFLAKLDFWGFEREACGIHSLEKLFRQFQVCLPCRWTGDDTVHVYKGSTTLAKVYKSERFDSVENPGRIGYPKS